MLAKKTYSLRMTWLGVGSGSPEYMAVDIGTSVTTWPACFMYAVMPVMTCMVDSVGSTQHCLVRLCP